MLQKDNGTVTLCSYNYSRPQDGPSRRCLCDQIAHLCQQRQLALEAKAEDYFYNTGNKINCECLLKNTLDVRKLSLLRSVSQDSDYSLDNYDLESSTFDATEFLEELGFAGATNPVIPERFIPSLIHRISSFPEEAVKNLDARILQFVGTLKRNEGRRKLFKNRSADQEHGLNKSEAFLLSEISDTKVEHRLQRSQSGPAAISDEKVPADVVREVNQTPETYFGGQPKAQDTESPPGRRTLERRPRLPSIKISCEDTLDEDASKAQHKSVCQNEGNDSKEECSPNWSNPLSNNGKSVTNETPSKKDCPDSDLDNATFPGCVAKAIWNLNEIPPYSKELSSDIVSWGGQYGWTLQPRYICERRCSLGVEYELNLSNSIRSSFSCPVPSYGDSSLVHSETTLEVAGEDIPTGSTAAFSSSATESEPWKDSECQGDLEISQSKHCGEIEIAFDDSDIKESSPLDTELTSESTLGMNYAQCDELQTSSQMTTAQQLPASLNSVAETRKSFSSMKPDVKKQSYLRKMWATSPCFHSSVSDWHCSNDYKKMTDSVEYPVEEELDYSAEDLVLEKSPYGHNTVVNCNADTFEKFSRDLVSLKSKSLDVVLNSDYPVDDITEFTHDGGRRMSYAIAADKDEDASMEQCADALSSDSDVIRAVVHRGDENFSELSMVSEGCTPTHLQEVEQPLEVQMAFQVKKENQTEVPDYLHRISTKNHHYEYSSTGNADKSFSLTSRNQSLTESCKLKDEFLEAAVDDRKNMVQLCQNCKTIFPENRHTSIGGKTEGNYNPSTLVNISLRNVKRSDFILKKFWLCYNVARNLSSSHLQNPPQIRKNMSSSVENSVRKGTDDHSRNALENSTASNSQMETVGKDCNRIKSGVSDSLNGYALNSVTSDFIPIQNSLESNSTEPTVERKTTSVAVKIGDLSDNFIESPRHVNDCSVRQMTQPMQFVHDDRSSAFKKPCEYSKLSCRPNSAHDHRHRKRSFSKEPLVSNSHHPPFKDSKYHFSHVSGPETNIRRMRNISFVNPNTPLEYSVDEGSHSSTCVHCLGRPLPLVCSWSDVRTATLKSDTPPNCKRCSSECSITPRSSSLLVKSCPSSVIVPGSPAALNRVRMKLMEDRRPSGRFSLPWGYRNLNVTKEHQTHSLVRSLPSTPLTLSGKESAIYAGTVKNDARMTKTWNLKSSEFEECSFEQFASDRQTNPGARSNRGLMDIQIDSSVASSSQSSSRSECPRLPRVGNISCHKIPTYETKGKKGCGSSDSMSDLGCTEQVTDGDSRNPMFKENCSSPAVSQSPLVTQPNGGEIIPPLRKKKETDVKTKLVKGNDQGIKGDAQTFKTNELFSSLWEAKDPKIGVKVQQPMSVEIPKVQSPPQSTERKTSITNHGESIEGDIRSFSKVMARIRKMAPWWSKSQGLGGKVAPGKRTKTNRSKSCDGMQDDSWSNTHRKATAADNRTSDKEQSFDDSRNPSDDNLLNWRIADKASNGRKTTPLQHSSLDNRSTSQVDVTNGMEGHVVESRDRLVFTSGVNIVVNGSDEDDESGHCPNLYYSAVYLRINEEEGQTNGAQINGTDAKAMEIYNHQGKKVPLNVPLDHPRPAIRQNSYQKASRDLEELRIAIQKAKETRLSASNELKLLQKLLLRDGPEKTATLNGSSSPTDSEENSSKEKLSIPNPTEVNIRQRLADAVSDLEESRKREVISLDQIRLLQTGLMDLQQDKIKMQKALSELQEKSKRKDIEDQKHWEEKIDKVREETEQEWQEKLMSTEEQLKKKLVELSEVQKENVILKEQLELRTLGSPTCQCSSKIKLNGFSQINGDLTEDETAVSPQTESSSPPTKETRQDYDRLQNQLMEMEKRADQLNLLLNQKLIELNKLQLTLSKQTKEMIQLEKAYFQLRCHLTKRGNKSFGSQLSPSSRISPALEKMTVKSISSASTPPEISP